METNWRAALEKTADEIEGIARTIAPLDYRKELFAKAWELKQIARAGTASQGI